MTERHNHPESQIAFHMVGGHSHDGENSTKIDFSKYDPEDFGPIADRVIQVITNGGNPATASDNGQDPILTIGDTVVMNKVDPPTGLVLTTGSIFTNYETVYIDAQWEVADDRSGNDFVSTSYFDAYLDVNYVQYGNPKDYFGQVVEYEVKLFRQGSAVSERTIRTVSTFCRFEPVDPSTDYTVEVRSVNPINIKSLPITANIESALDTTIPSTVGGLTATPTFRGLLLKWTHVSDADVKNARGTYRVQIDATSAAFANVIVDKVLTANVVGISDLAITQHWVRVMAIDSSENVGAWSSTVSATPVLVGGTNDIVADSITAASIASATITATELIDAFEISVTQDIYSSNYSAGVDGWIINGSGSAEFNDVTVRGDLESDNYTAGVDGWTLSRTGTAEINELVARGTVQSGNYVLDTSGWKIDNTGDAEFNDAVIRGTYQSAYSGARMEISDNALGGQIVVHYANGEQTPTTFTGTASGSSGTRANRIEINTGQYSGRQGAFITLQSENAGGTTSTNVRLNAVNILIDDQNSWASTSGYGRFTRHSSGSGLTISSGSSTAPIWTVSAMGTYPVVNNGGMSVNGATGGTITDPIASSGYGSRIQSGTDTATWSGSPYTGSVTFPHAFASVSAVTCTPWSAADCYVVIASVSTTGFTYYSFRNDGSSTFETAATVELSWIAVGY